MLFVSFGFYGYVFPYFIDPNTIQLNEILDWSIAFAATIAIVVVYEAMNFRLKTERDKQSRQLEFMATHDALTQLPNRVLFQDRIASAISRARRNNSQFALFTIDLDDFKAINDNYGHSVGDEVLRSIATRIRQALRDSDVVARLGGDEFSLLIEGVCGEKSIDVVIDKLMSEIGRSLAVAGEEFSIGASIGVALYPSNGTSEEDLLVFADNEMYICKQHRKHSQSEAVDTVKV